MNEERLREVKELEKLDDGSFGNVALDNGVCELAAKFAYEDMITESKDEIERGEHLIEQEAGNFDMGPNCWFNDLFDNYYEEIYEEILCRMNLYQQNRERQLLHYQDVYCETYFDEQL